jgi:hypothetical protein
MKMVNGKTVFAKSEKPHLCFIKKVMTVSRLYMNGTLRSCVHYIQLRSGNGTQKEHREVAVMCANVIESIFQMKNFLT